MCVDREKFNINQDRFTNHSRESRLVILDNPAFRETTWIRDGRKHWAYAARAFVPTRDRHQIEWTPGVPELSVSQSAPAKLDVTLHSVTPNCKAWQMRMNESDWQTVTGDKFQWELNAGKNRLDVRTQNQFEVTGPIVTANVLFESDAASKNK
jgi:hypothetical protein